jgi:hypothetical protein
MGYAQKGSRIAQEVIEMVVVGPMLTVFPVYTVLFFGVPGHIGDATMQIRRYVSPPAPRNKPSLNSSTDSRYHRFHLGSLQAIIYVIDSSDVARLPTSRSELLTMLSEDELKHVPVLVFANKQVRISAFFLLPPALPSC